MHSIKVPNLPTAYWYDAIQKSKEEPTKGELASARSVVLSAGALYAQSAPAVDTLKKVTLSNLQEIALCHAYDSPTKAMDALRGELMSPKQSPRCPFCGIGEAGTLDHYLPKKQYPAFAVLPINLVPCCDICNRRKKDRVLQLKVSVRLFLHPYFDNIPQFRLISVKIRSRADSLGTTWKYDPPSGVSVSASAHIKAHFDELDLADRYRRFSIDELRGQASAFDRDFLKGGPSLLSEELRAKADSFAHGFGPNHWRVVLYEALAADTHFCSAGFKVALKK